MSAFITNNNLITESNDSDSTYSDLTESELFDMEWNFSSDYENYEGEKTNGDDEISINNLNVTVDNNEIEHEKEIVLQSVNTVQTKGFKEDKKEDEINENKNNNKDDKSDSANILVSSFVVVGSHPTDDKKTSPFITIGGHKYDDNVFTDLKQTLTNLEKINLI